MANSKKSRPSKSCPVLLEVEQQLKALGLNPSSKLLLGFSGGLDSSVLLQVLHQLNQSIPFQLTAMHVHHGLSPHADDWANFCREVCAQMSVPFLLEKVHVDVASGLGTEAAAREVRYRALHGTQTDWLCLAQHKDDQAETLLMQLARGAGVKGLSGMAPVDATRKIIRPLLNLGRDQLHAYADQHKLRWVEDESNVNTAFDRNWWRVEVLPLLKKRYPAIVETLSRSARHLAETNILLDDLARLDATNCIVEQRMDLARFAALSEVRQRNLLRGWLMQRRVQLPSEARLQQACRQMACAGLAKAIHVTVSADMEIRSYRGGAYLLESRRQQRVSSGERCWHGESVIRLQDGSSLVFDQVMGSGIALRHLNQPLNIGYRRGGERICLEENRPTRSLKTWLQMHDIPPWQRKNIPLLYLNNTLAAIPNLGCAIRYSADMNEPGLVVSWKPA